MANYILGAPQDYIPQIQAFQPDLNFYGNVMQTRQGRYDSAKKKVSDLYGSLLYSPLSRENNIKRREEFFNVIDNDIKRISGMDLSLQQNQDAALNVFKGFYEDKYMINDMVKTKNAYAQVDRGKNFKNCNDPEKCGGQYWEPGMQKLMYKMDEFKNVSDDESLNYQIGEFDPYYDWKKDAAKKAKELGYEVKQDTVQGKWIVRDSNGKLVQGGLYNLFTSLYGDDPRVQSNYDTQAYVTRKNFAKGNAAQFGSEEEAEKQYIMNNINQGLKDANSNMKEVSDSFNQVNSTFMKLDRKRKTGAGLTPQEKQAYQIASQQKAQLENSKATLQSRIDNIQNNIDANDIDSLRRRADLSTATSFENSDMIGLAHSLAEIKKEHTLEVNPYAKMYEEFGLQKQLAGYKHLLDLDKMKHEYGYKFKLEESKGAIKTNQIPTEGYMIEGAPWANAKENLEDNPSLLYDRNVAERNAKLQTASAGSNAALFQLYQAAQNAYKANPNENAGAKQFLDQFGKSEITNPESLQKAITDNKKNALGMFTSIVNQASMKNNPTGDFDWARPILNQKGGVIDDIKFANEAFHAKFNQDLKTNKKVAAAIAGTLSAENPVASHANLLISDNGFLVDESTFIKKYIATNEAHDIKATSEDAKDAYQALTKQFFSTYNSTEGISLTQGVGLTGGGMITAPPQQFIGLDLLKKGSDKVVTDVIRTTNQAIANPATTTIAIGDPSKETLEQGTDEAIADFLTFYLNQADLTDKSKNRSFSAVVSNIAAEDPTKAAITFKGIDPDVIKQYEGSKNNPKLFFGKDLSKGITVFFDKSVQPNPFEKPIGNLETVLYLNGHAKSTGFQDLAGTVDWSFDKNTNRVQAIWHKAGYDGAGNWIEAGPQKVLVDREMGSLESAQATVNAALQAQAQANIKRGTEIATLTKGN